MTQKATNDLPDKAGPEAVSLDSAFSLFFSRSETWYRTLRAPRGEDKNKSIRFQILSLLVFFLCVISFVWRVRYVGIWGEPVLAFLRVCLVCVDGGGGGVGEGSAKSGQIMVHVRRYYPAAVVKKKKGQGIVCTRPTKLGILRSLQWDRCSFLLVIEWVPNQGIRKSFAHGNMTLGQDCGSAVQAESFLDTPYAGEGP